MMLSELYSLRGRDNQCADEQVGRHILAEDDSHPVDVRSGIGAEAVHQNTKREAENRR
jgi:hypothetical protein